MNLRHVCAVAAFVFAPSIGACQSGPAPQLATAASAPTLAALQGGYFRLDSAILERPLHIYVTLPENYQSETQAYPTVYLTDGDSLFPLLSPTHLFLTYDEPVPPAIIVGVAYGTFNPNAGNMRGQDYRAPDPATPEANAAAYQRFLAEELIPEIERRYRSDPQRRILVGQSRGASFVLYSALANPDLFWGRIASNAALTPNRDAFFAEPALATRADLRLFVASGARDRPNLRADALAWFEHWNRRPKPWRLNTVTIENGTHAASIGQVYGEGMIWLFSAPP